MSTFCLIAYIPCIFLVIWLFIELRKFLIVNKKLKRAVHEWRKLEEMRARRERGRLVESIPPPPPRTDTEQYYEDLYGTPPSYDYLHPVPPPHEETVGYKRVYRSTKRRRTHAPPKRRHRAPPRQDYMDDYSARPYKRPKRGKSRTKKYKYTEDVDFKVADEVDWD